MTLELLNQKIQKAQVAYVKALDKQNKLKRKLEVQTIKGDKLRAKLQKLQIYAGYYEREGLKGKPVVSLKQP